MDGRTKAILGCLLVVACGSGAGAPDSGPEAGLDAGGSDGGATARPSARGVFVPVTFGAFNATATADAMQALASPDVDGIAIDVVWTQIAASAPRTYEFAQLDALLRLARDAHKGVELAVVGAGGTPSWFDPQTLVHLQYTPHNGATDRCYDTLAPPPWDAAYLAAWDDMTGQLAAHVASAGFSDTVVALRLTGMNASTPETHLPTQAPASLAKPPACLTVDSVAAWHAAGYTPTKIKAAWAAMVTSWATHFPATPFELVLWGEASRFPPIDDSGTIVAPSQVADRALYDAIVDEAAKRLGARLVLGYWFLLTGTPVNGDTVAYANKYGLGTLWQTNLWWRAHENLTKGTVPGAAACGGTLTAPVQCTDPTFQDELGQGLHPAGQTGATRVIEAFVPDPALYPVATRAAHQALTQ